MRTDVFTSEKRSEIMSHVKSRDTKPERMIRSSLHKMGYRFRLHRKDLPGTPDIVLPKYRVVVFVHGCFWHQHPNCKRATIPKQNSAFWETKLVRNRERDLVAQQELKRLGWNVIIIWTCEVGQGLETLLAKIRQP